MFLRFKSTKEVDFNIPIISIGNLNVGGSGKTPLTIALAKKYENVAIILRGYGRNSRGLYVVKKGGNILESVDISGDEAMIYARKLPNSIVIVSEDRVLGVQKARELGAELIFLDDGYSKHHIKKLDFLIDLKSENRRCLPAGAYRERAWSDKKVVIIDENVDFKRVSHVESATSKMSLVTAIARPQRLDEFLPEVVSKNYFEDHHIFTKDELEEIVKKDNSDSILVTYKDFVKMESFGINISLLELELDVDSRVFEAIDEYIGN